MDCKQWREIASEYIEGALPPGAHEAMRLHAASCASCHRDEAALGVLCRELNVLPSVDPPLFFAENVRARIERQRKTQVASSAPWWQSFFFGGNSAAAAAGARRRQPGDDTPWAQRPLYEQIGRVAVGTLLTGGVVAAIAWTLLLAGPSNGGHTTLATALPVPGLPAESTEAGGAKEPTLRIAQVTTMSPGSGPAYDLSFWIDNADHGVASWKFVGDPKAYSFMLRHDAPQTVRVPYSVADGNKAIALSVHWTGGGTPHTRYIILPGSASGVNSAAADGSHSDMPADRQSFGLPEEGLIDAARDTAGRYGVAISLDDVSESTQVRVTAQDETAADALRHSLQGIGLRVTTDAAGVHVASASPPPSSDTAEATAPESSVSSKSNGE